MQKNNENRPFRDLFWPRHTKNNRTSFYRDVRSIYEFYLPQKERAKLNSMGWFKRSTYRSIWFVKSILSKLSVSRRFLLLLSVFFLFSSQDESRFYIAFALVVIILLLELKDKLLAHDELKAGRAIQEAMRPQKRTELEGWDIFLYSQSANEVGGDLVNCLNINEDHTGFMVGDVSGKGLGAALLMAQLQASVEALIAHIPKLPQLVVQLNKLYCREDLQQNFISFILLQAAANKGRIDYVNAGHLPPMIISKGRVTEMEKGSLALGLSPTTKYKQESIVLGPGDMLVVYTDGVTEARNEKGEFYSDERFFHFLESLSTGSSANLGQAVINDVENFSGKAERNDDLTLMILRRTGEK